MDWSFLAWFVPLLIGSALTFGVHWLDNYFRDRRQGRLSEAEYERARQAEIRKAGQTHADEALTIITNLHSTIQAEAHNKSFGTWVSPDKTALDQLRNRGVRIPDATLRECIDDAANLISAPSLMAEATNYESMPLDYQIQAAFHLRSLLGAYVRGDKDHPAADLEWLQKHARAQEEEWEHREKEEERLALRSDD